MTLFNIISSSEFYVVRQEMSSKKSQSPYSEPTEMTDAVLIVGDRKFYVAKIVSREMILFSNLSYEILLRISSKNNLFSLTAA